MVAPDCWIYARSDGNRSLSPIWERSIRDAAYVWTCRCACDAANDVSSRIPVPPSICRQLTQSKPNERSAAHVCCSILATSSVYNWDTPAVCPQITDCRSHARWPKVIEEISWITNIYSIWCELIYLHEAPRFDRLIGAWLDFVFA